MRRITRKLERKLNETGQLSQLEPGATLQERYLVLGILGRGGMSAVYKGRDLHFPNVTKLVAIKEMINLAADPTMHEMIVRNFEREADILATLSHPAIPRIFDYFSQASSSYLAMEFIEGKDLETLLQDSKDFLPEEQIVTWAIELCDVLTYLHNHKPQPVIFRDMKPSNIMIDLHEHIRLIDFGIARVFQPGQKGTMIGTEGYSPPEQYRGEASPPGDIYASAPPSITCSPGAIRGPKRPSRFTIDRFDSSTPAFLPNLMASSARRSPTTLRTDTQAPRPSSRPYSAPPSAPGCSRAPRPPRF